MIPLPTGIKIWLVAGITVSVKSLPPVIPVPGSLA